MTQVDVAYQLGKHQSYISKCDSGERRVDLVELLDFAEIYKKPSYRCDPYRIWSADKLERVLTDYPKLRICVPHLGFDDIAEYRTLIEKYDTLWLDTTMVLTDYFPIKEIVELKAYRLERVMYQDRISPIFLMHGTES